MESVKRNLMGEVGGWRVGVRSDLTYKQGCPFKDGYKHVISNR